MAKKEREIEVAVAEVVNYLRLTGGFAPALKEVVGRKVTAEAARKKGMKITTAQLQKAADGFRLAHGLHKASDTERWLKSNGISLDAFEEHLETNLLIARFKEDLEKKANRKRTPPSPGLKELLREILYREWLTQELK